MYVLAYLVYFFEKYILLCYQYPYKINPPHFFQVSCYGRCFSNYLIQLSPFGFLDGWRKDKNIEDDFGWWRSVAYLRFTVDQ